MVVHVVPPSADATIDAAAERGERPSGSCTRSSALRSIAPLGSAVQVTPPSVLRTMPPPKRISHVSEPVGGDEGLAAHGAGSGPGSTSRRRRSSGRCRTQDLHSCLAGRSGRRSRGATRRTQCRRAGRRTHCSHVAPPSLDRYTTGRSCVPDSIVRRSGSVRSTLTRSLSDDVAELTERHPVVVGAVHPAALVDAALPPPVRVGPGRRSRATSGRLMIVSDPAPCRAASRCPIRRRSTTGPVARSPAITSSRSGRTNTEVRLPHSEGRPTRFEVDRRPRRGGDSAVVVVVVAVVVVDVRWRGRTRVMSSPSRRRSTGGRGTRVQGPVIVAAARRHDHDHRDRSCDPSACSCSVPSAPLVHSSLEAGVALVAVERAGEAVRRVGDRGGDERALAQLAEPARVVPVRVELDLAVVDRERIGVGRPPSRRT